MFSVEEAYFKKNYTKEGVQGTNREIKSLQRREISIAQLSD